MNINTLDFQVLVHLCHTHAVHFQQFARRGPFFVGARPVGPVAPREGYSWGT